MTLWKSGRRGLTFRLPRKPELFLESTLPPDFVERNGDRHGNVETVHSGGQGDPQNLITGFPREALDPASFTPRDKDRRSIKQPFMQASFTPVIQTQNPESRPPGLLETPHQIWDGPARDPVRSPGGTFNRRGIERSGPVPWKHNPGNTERGRRTETGTQIARVLNPIQCQQQTMAIGSLKPRLKITPGTGRATLAIRSDLGNHSLMNPPPRPAVDQGAVHLGYRHSTLFQHLPKDMQACIPTALLDIESPNGATGYPCRFHRMQAINPVQPLSSRGV